MLTRIKKKHHQSGILVIPNNDSDNDNLHSYIRVIVRAWNLLFQYIIILFFFYTLINWA